MIPEPNLTKIQEDFNFLASEYSRYVEHRDELNEEQDRESDRVFIRLNQLSITLLYLDIADRVFNAWVDSPALYQNIPAVRHACMWRIPEAQAHYSYGGV